MNPYTTLAKQHMYGLNAIITSIGAGGPATVTLDKLTKAVYDYISSVYTDFATNPKLEADAYAAIANAINGYMANGESSPYLGPLLSVPVASLSSQFDKIFDASKTASTIKITAESQQMVVAIGKVDVEHWRNQIAAKGPWTPYLNGNAAIDTATIPFWTDAAMFGAMTSLGQLKSTDARAATPVFPIALIGSLVLAAGKVVFGWVPNNAKGSLSGPAELKKPKSDPVPPLPQDYRPFESVA